MIARFFVGLLSFLAPLLLFLTAWVAGCVGFFSGLAIPIQEDWLANIYLSPENTIPALSVVLVAFSIALLCFIAFTRLMDRSLYSRVFDKK